MSRDVPARPNALRAAWSVVFARRVSRPRPAGSGTVDHSALVPVLAGLRGPNPLGDVDVAAVDHYLETMAAVDPDQLSRREALAYWINLYNAGAIRLAAGAFAAGTNSVLRVPGAFDARDLSISGESLSLNDVEHGKIRRFGVPAIHGALVCGSLSCPTLRSTPFVGETIEDDLDEQMRVFLQSGGAQADAAGSLHLSRIFLWYGADFVRPGRMPTLLPAGRAAVVRAATRWMDPEMVGWVRATNPRVVFQPYDWGLGCAVG